MSPIQYWWRHILKWLAGLSYSVPHLSVCVWKWSYYSKAYPIHWHWCGHCGPRDSNCTINELTRTFELWCSDSFVVTFQQLTISWTSDNSCFEFWNIFYKLKWILTTVPFTCQKDILSLFFENDKRIVLLLIFIMYLFVSPGPIMHWTVGNYNWVW